MKIAQGKKIKLEYELAVDGGETIESSAARGPLEYVHGSGVMLPGLESRIDGLEKGDEKEGVIPAAEAYGTADMLPTKDIPRREFPAGEPLEVGKVFEAKDQTGTPVKFSVIKISGDVVKVRFDHPLVGRDIRFKVKILEVSETN